MAIKEGLLAEFDHEMATTRKLLARLPDDKLAWKPHQRSMSLGGLATHIANLPNWADEILNKTSFDMGALPPPLAEKTAVGDILSWFDGAVSRARGFLDKTDAEYMARWTLKRGDQEIFSIPRIAAFRGWVLSHVIHHRGQLSVYLRMNEIPVPAIYGASADEG
jgi:uncharacterized damage-inducible protein DinB